jgi:RES domain-containing protein
MTIWRLSKAKYANDALSGYGARLHAGRWHRKGLSMVYLAGSPALALLEKLVHVNRPEELTGFDWKVVSVTAEERHVQPLSEEDLPSNWDAWPWPASTQRIGSRWFEEQKSVVLAVPSAVVPHQRNYLLNPTHPQLESLEIGEPEPFPIDRRLITASQR